MTHLHSLEAEAAVLGALIYDSSATLSTVREIGLSSESFFHSPHRQVWEAINDLASVGTGIDLTTVTERLKRKAQLDEIGGSLFLHHLIDASTTTAHTAYHAGIVRERETARRGAAIFAAGQNAMKEADADAASVVADVQSQLIGLTNSERTSRVRQLKEFKEDKLKQWDTALTQGFVGVPSCFDQLNDCLGGFRPGVMTILAGYRGEGKSTLCRQEVLEMARLGYRVGLFTLEDPGDLAAASIIGNIADVSVFHLDQGKGRPSDLPTMAKAWEENSDLPLWISQNVMTMTEITSAAMVLKAKYDVQIIFIDHIQLIMPYRLAGASRNDTVAAYSQGLVSIAKRLDVPVIALSQFSRDSEKQARKPRLSDLRDSGALEQDARQVLLLYYDGDKQHHILEVAKNNYGPSRTSLGIRRLDGLQRFEEIRPHSDPF